MFAPGSLLLLCLLGPPFGFFFALGLECEVDCHPDRGICEKDQCRCRPGWQGPLCNECVPFPGCLHGSCSLPWQCICEDGWIGSLCDIDLQLCAAKPCPKNGTCIGSEEGGSSCSCASGSSGRNCHFKEGPCVINGSPCQNGGACIDDNGLASYTSCLCPDGFSGNFCELNMNSCDPNPCENGGMCTDIGGDFRCRCPLGFMDKTCGRRVGDHCASDPCEHGGTCVPHTRGGFECLCKPEFSGPTCNHGHPNHSHPGPKTKRGPGLPDQFIPETQGRIATHQPSHRMLKITMRELTKNSKPLFNESQAICFTILGVLTCLVVLGTISIVFFNKCEVWFSNAKYSRLLRKKKNLLLRYSNGDEHTINIILPEKMNLKSYSKCLNEI
ncbi:protein delta homolog 1 [Gracilinanus agilis]|uniref:protein delta homolog 1 n=1 Tax=Gracilinanus agilis TaxID=191870 RepID=UPI001CFD4546|nr:protein delta homolog 1 [Gracilinanus agilis]